MSDPNPDDVWSFAGVNAVVVNVEGRARVLVHDMDKLGGKMCCPVAGWLDPTVVAFQSGPELLAWDLPTGAVRRVTEFTGLQADDEAAFASWALAARDQ